MLPGAFSRASGLVRDLRPQLVLGVGGYASGPMLLAAAARGVAHRGFSSRTLTSGSPTGCSPRPRRGSTSRSKRPRRRWARTRRASSATRCGARSSKRRATRLVDPEGFEARADRILVLGGSQGARALNRLVPEALGRVDPTGRGLRIIHQTGAAMRAGVEARYRELGVDAEVVTFIDDMAAAYRSAALVIARRRRDHPRRGVRDRSGLDPRAVPVRGRRPSSEERGGARARGRRDRDARVGARRRASGRRDRRAPR